MLTINHIKKVYDKKVIALHNISFTIEQDEIFGLIGPNGSGKTTMIGIITNLIAPSDGKVMINGFPRESKQAKKLIGYVPDELLLPETLSGKEYIDFVQRMYQVSSQKRLNQLIDLFDLRDAMGRMIRGYSHGMKKKLQIISALQHNPKLLILDEPFRGLDPEAVWILKKVLRRSALQGASILLSTHDLNMAEELCNRVGIISKGELVEVGHPIALIKKYHSTHLEEVFLQASKLLQRSFEHEKNINDL